MTALTTLAPVIPPSGKERNSDQAMVEAELSKLYCLVVIALYLHTPGAEPDLCGICLTAWPCAQMRRAGHLIEVF